MKNKSITILICEDHQLVRTGFKEILNKRPDMEVIAEIEDGIYLLDAYKKYEPDIVITDIEMARKSGMDAADELIKKHPESRVLFLSIYYSDLIVADAYMIGAKGFLSKYCDSTELFHAVTEIYEGRRYFGEKYPEELLEKVTDKIKRQKKVTEMDILSETDQRILYYISQGLSSKEIANKISASEHTISAHRKALMEKFEFENYQELIGYSATFVQANKNGSVITAEMQKENASGIFH